MSLLILGLILFLGAHSVHMLAPRFRERVVARIGLMPWKGLYSIVSIAGFVLIVIGFGMARANPQLLYVPPAWLRHLNALFTLVAFVLIAAAYVPRNHLKAKIGHPMLAGVKLWAVAHLLANGDLGSIILFGSFLAWAVYDRISLKRRSDPGAPPIPVGGVGNDIIAVVLGIVIYLALAFVFHPLVIGVPVMGA